VVVVVVVVVLSVVLDSAGAGLSPALLLAPASSSPTLVAPEAAQPARTGSDSATISAKSTFFNMTDAPWRRHQ
jgi:hypothetical protein